MGEPTREELVEARKWIARLIKTAGCSCCRDNDGWERAVAELGRLFKVPRYKDGSGYDWYRIARAPDSGARAEGRVRS